MRLHHAPECFQMRMERAIPGNRGRIGPHIMLEATERGGQTLLSSPMGISWIDTKLGCDRFRVSDISKNPERGAEAEEVLGFFHLALDFRSHSYCSTNVAADQRAWSGMQIRPVVYTYMLFRDPNRPTAGFASRR